MNIKRRCLTSILLVMAMLMALVPMSAFASTVDDSGLVTSVEFDLLDYAYGNFVSPCRAFGESGITFNRGSKVLECTAGTFSSYSDLSETTDWYFVAGKQYYLKLEFSAHPDCDGFAASFAPSNATLKFNGTACEYIGGTTGFDEVNQEKFYTSYYRLPLLTEIPLGIDFTTVIEKGGDVAPEAGAFELEVLNYEEGSNTPVSSFTVGGKNISTNGVGSFPSKLTISTADFGKLKNLIAEGILVRQKKGTAEGWTYDEAVWFVTFVSLPEINSLTDDAVATLPGYDFACTKGKLVNGEFVADDETADPVSAMTFTNTYTAAAPETGDASDIALWTAILLAACLGIAATMIYSKKKSCVR